MRLSRREPQSFDLNLYIRNFFLSPSFSLPADDEFLRYRRQEIRLPVTLFRFVHTTTSMCTAHHRRKEIAPTSQNSVQILLPSFSYVCTYIYRVFGCTFTISYIYDTSTRGGLGGKQHHPLLDKRKGNAEPISLPFLFFRTLPRG